MGMFSWLTQDSDRSISNKHSDRGTFVVYLLDNKGNSWKEDNYEGYGVFGGKDYYDLLAEMNGRSGREEGINLEFGTFAEKEEMLFPNIVEEIEEWQWINEQPESCEYQGFFYGDDYEDSNDEFEEKD